MPTGAEQARQLSHRLSGISAVLEAVPPQVIGRVIQQTHRFALREYGRQVQLVTPADAAIRVRRGGRLGGQAPVARLWLGYQPIVADYVRRRVRVVRGASLRQRKVSVGGHVVPGSFVLDLPSGRRLHLQRTRIGGRSRTRRVAVPVEAPVRRVFARTVDVATKQLRMVGGAALADVARVRESHAR